MVVLYQIIYTLLQLIILCLCYPELKADKVKNQQGKKVLGDHLEHHCVFLHF